MTTGTDREVDRADDRQWAAEQLGIAPFAAPADVRAAFLRQLEKEEFVPPIYVKQAFDLLEGRPRRVESALNYEEEAQLLEEQRLRGELDEFSRDFFTRPPDERRQQWQTLLERCRSYPALTARVQELERGLGVTQDEVRGQGAKISELAHDVCDLFVLAPPRRATRRQDLLNQMVDNYEWRATARRLEKEHRGIAALAPDFLKQLAEGPRKPQPVANPPLPRRLTTPARAPSGKPDGSSGGGSYVGWWIAIAIILAIIRAASSPSNRGNTSKDLKLNPNYQLPTFQSPNYDYPRYPFSSAPTFQPSDPWRTNPRPDLDKLREEQRRRLEEIRKGGGGSPQPNNPSGFPRPGQPARPPGSPSP